MAKKWKRPRVCPACAQVHEKPEEAKSNGTDYFCTWCETKLK